MCVMWNLNSGTCSVTPETSETLVISPKGDPVATGHYETGLVWADKNGDWLRNILCGRSG